MVSGVPATPSCEEETPSGKADEEGLYFLYGPPRITQLDGFFLDSAAKGDALQTRKRPSDSTSVRPTGR